MFSSSGIDEGPRAAVRDPDWSQAEGQHRRELELNFAVNRNLNYTAYGRWTLALTASFMPFWRSGYEIQA